jgi:hypothetical protein
MIKREFRTALRGPHQPLRAGETERSCDLILAELAGRAQRSGPEGDKARDILALVTALITRATTKR